MNMELFDLGNDAVKIALSGRMDALGIDRNETRFTAQCAATSRHVIIDLSEVTFIASLGIRLLISNARVVNRRHYKMILFGAQELVREVLDQTALNDIIPVVENEEQARERLM
jgi:anti-sigma B factor antagonist